MPRSKTRTAMTEYQWLRSKRGGELVNLLVRLDRGLSERKFQSLFDEGVQVPFLPRQRRPIRDEAEALRYRNAGLANLTRELFGNPFQPYRFEPSWRTEAVLSLTLAIVSGSGFDRMPILADALEEAGCDEESILEHARGPGPHAYGCWVLDLILEREAEFFAGPPVKSERHPRGRQSEQRTREMQRDRQLPG